MKNAAGTVRGKAVIAVKLAAVVPGDKALQVLANVFAHQTPDFWANEGFVFLHLLLGAKHEVRELIVVEQHVAGGQNHACVQIGSRFLRLNVKGADGFDFVPEELNANRVQIGGYRQPLNGASIL